MKNATLGFARYRTPMLAVMITLGSLVLAQPSHAAACANGVYRAGCVGPNGAVGAIKMLSDREERTAFVALVLSGIWMLARLIISTNRHSLREWRGHAISHMDMIG